MTDLLAYATSTGDRRAARDLPIELMLSNDSLMSVSERGPRSLTGALEAATFVDWMDLPSVISPTANNGGVLVSDARASYLVLIDDWWLSPVLVSSPEVALRSSGLQLLLERFPPHPEASVGALARDAVVLGPTNSRRASFQRVLLASATVLGGVAMLLVVFGPILSALTSVSESLWFVIKAVAVLALAAAVFVTLAGRIRGRVRGIERILEPAAGPPWFRKTAFVGLRRGAVVLGDGQGMLQYLRIDADGSGDSALRRAEFVGGDDGRVILRDGAGVIRAQLPARVWIPDDARRRELQAWFQALGVLTAAGHDEERSTSRSLDDQRNRSVAVDSLMAPTVLGVHPIPFVAGAAFFSGVIGSIEQRGEPLALTVLGWVLGMSTILAVILTIVVEAAGRLAVAPRLESPPEASDRSSGPGLRNVLLALALAVVAAAWFVREGNALGAIDAALFGGIFVVGGWLSNRRRRAEQGNEPIGFVRWLVEGARRGDE